MLNSSIVSFHKTIYSEYFQAYVRLGTKDFVGDDRCLKLKDAEQSAAKHAYKALNVDFQNQSSRQRLPQQLYLPSARSPLQMPRSTKHMPAQYQDSELFIVNIIRLEGGRIRKIWAPDEQGRYQLEITGTYRYCENIGRHHKKNHIYFLVDPDQRTYCQKCHDPDCSGFQSITRVISGNERRARKTNIHLINQ